MAQYRPGGRKTNIWVWVVTVLVAVIGVILIVVVNFTNVVEWLRICGVAMLFCALPVLLWLVYTAIKNKIDEM